MLEKWSDGRYREVLREHGRFVKGHSQKIIERPSENLTYFVPKTEIPKPRLYRAVVFIDGVPICHKYHHFGIVKIDERENINIEEMKEKLIAFIENEINYHIGDWWFYHEFGVQYPEPNYTSSGKIEDYEHSIL